MKIGPLKADCAQQVRKLETIVNSDQSTQQLSIGGKKIGPGAPCFITFEAGPTHDGVPSAKRLIDHAARAGADAIKFQIFDADRLVADRKQLFSYKVLVDRETGELEEVSEPLFDILMRRQLNADQWREVKAHADSAGLAFFSTVAFEEDIELVSELGCDSIKIASADVNHFPLLRQAARTGISIQLDTGNSTLGEIEKAVDVIRDEGNDKIIIHQCPSGYPARLESINLNVLSTLRQMFGLPVAFSDHTPGSEMDIAAVAIGADLVEKTITEDKTTRSVEHVMSLEPAEMASFVNLIRDVETALGSTRRVMTREERQKALAVRRSVFLSEPGRAGQKLRDLKVDFRRPGFGIAPDQYEELLDLVLLTDMEDGAMLHPFHLGQTAHGA